MDSIALYLSSSDDSGNETVLATERRILRNNFNILEIPTKTGYCNFEKQCKEMSEFIQENNPGTEVICSKGRQGAFEVKIDDKLVYSKIQRVAFPEYQSVANNVQNVIDGKPLEKVKEQKINDCSLM